MNHEGNNSPPLSAGRQADERLIHALLVHLHDSLATQDRERRVARAMQAIRQSESAGVNAATSRIRLFPLWAKRVAWAAAAVVLVAIGLTVLTYTPQPAMASVNDILAALGRPGDRTYHMTVVELPEPPEPRAPAEPTIQVPRPGLDGATLYLRDATQYLLVRSDPHGGLMFDGYDGQRSWRVKNGQLAETKEGPGAGGIPMPSIMADVPFSDLRRTLERIQVDYKVERLDQTPLPGGNAVLRHVVARRSSREVKGPETIEIWADPATGLPRCIIFDRAKFQGSPEPHRLTLQLSSAAPLAADWFTPAPHLTAAGQSSR